MILHVVAQSKAAETKDKGILDNMKVPIPHFKACKHCGTFDPQSSLPSFGSHSASQHRHSQSGMCEINLLLWFTNLPKASLISLLNPLMQKSTMRSRLQIVWNGGGTVAVAQ